MVNKLNKKNQEKWTFFFCEEGQVRYCDHFFHSIIIRFEYETINENYIFYSNLINKSNCLLTLL